MSWGYEEFLPESLRYAISPPDLEELDREEVYTLAENGGRDAKNAAVLSLQQAVDAKIDEIISLEEYQRVKEETVEAVNDYYNNEDVGVVHPPDTELSTRQSGFLTHESPVRHFTDQLAQYEKIETVIPVASGGLEPGIVASEALDADLSVLRYSTNDHEDSQPIEVEENYTGRNVLVVDDTSYSGDTLRTVEGHVKENGAAEVATEAVIEGKFVGTSTVVNSYMKDLRDFLS